tara:strand:- start:700 stop:1662 length:963 start_codon:yes stop_codon:yes gene_type:complete
MYLIGQGRYPFILEITDESQIKGHHMFDKKKVNDLVLSSLAADAYSLGAHWIYDAQQLETLDINWEVLNDAQASWHEGKLAGDFTHYGDQTLWLYQFLEGKEHFDVSDYMAFWQSKIESYHGYIDGAVKGTLENIENKVIPTGSASIDTSIIGRIAPLLLVSDSKEAFLDNVVHFVTSTHNSQELIVASKFFASVLVEVLAGKGIEQAILELKTGYDTMIQAYIDKGLDSHSANTVDAIRSFGAACDIGGGFPSVIHLLAKYDNLKDMLIQNAKAGGDSSGRAMIATIIFMAQKNKSMDEIPSAWLKINATIAESMRSAP